MRKNVGKLKIDKDECQMNKKLINSPSVDAREVAHYQKLADAWWDPTGPFWPLHTLNNVRIEWIVRQIRQSMPERDQSSLPLEGLSVLDVGCGGGILSESLSQLGAKVMGIDVVEKNIQVARKHATAELDIDYQHTTAEVLRESGQRFDMVFNMEVVEHVADLNSFMSACNALVKPGGATFIATINRNWLAWLIAIVGAEIILGWLPRGTHHYHMLRQPSEINHFLKQDNFIVQNTVGVAVNPINRTMKITRMLWVNYMLHATRQASC